MWAGAKSWLGYGDDKPADAPTEKMSEDDLAGMYDSSPRSAGSHKDPFDYYHFRCMMPLEPEEYFRGMRYNSSRVYKEETEFMQTVSYKVTDATSSERVVRIYPLKKAPGWLHSILPDLQLEMVSRVGFPQYMTNVVGIRPEIPDAFSMETVLTKPGEEPVFETALPRADTKYPVKYIDVDIVADYWTEYKEGEDPSKASFGGLPLLTEGWKEGAKMCVHKLIRVIRPNGMLKPVRGTLEAKIISGIGKELADNVGRRVLHTIDEWRGLTIEEIVADKKAGES